MYKKYILILRIMLKKIKVYTFVNKVLDK